MPPPFDHAGRLGRLRLLLADQAVDALVLTAGADLYYLTGYRAVPLERPTALVVPPRGDPVLLVPGLEAPRVPPGSPCEVRPWAETDDPVALVAGLLPGAVRVAVADDARAAFVLALQERQPAARFSAASPLTRELRMRKAPQELELLARAAAAADRAAARLRDHRFSGKTEVALSREVAALCLDEGLDACAFAIVAAGPNGASPHHEPGDRVVGPGDGVVVDFGGPLGGYGCDVTRSFAVGDPGDEYRRVHEVVRQAQQAGLDAIRPGGAAQDVDRACRRVIAEAGYGPFFVHRTGHGIGLEAHEHPYLVEGNELVLEAGMTFSVEPGVYLPGRFGVRIEDVAVVTSDGCRRLNLAPRDLTPVA